MRDLERGYCCNLFIHLTGCKKSEEQCVMNDSTELS